MDKNNFRVNYSFKLITKNIGGHCLDVKEQLGLDILNNPFCVTQFQKTLVPINDDKMFNFGELFW